MTTISNAWKAAILDHLLRIAEPTVVDDPVSWQRTGKNTWQVRFRWLGCHTFLESLLRTVPEPWPEVVDTPSEVVRLTSLVASWERQYTTLLEENQHKDSIIKQLRNPPVTPFEEPTL